MTERIHSSCCLTFDIFLNILFQAYLVGFGASVVFTVSNECAIMKDPPLETQHVNTGNKEENWESRLLTASSSVSLMAVIGTRGGVRVAERC